MLCVLALLCRPFVRAAEPHQGGNMLYGTGAKRLSHTTYYLRPAPQAPVIRPPPVLYW
jgi:hypothetical protein